MDTAPWAKSRDYGHTTVENQFHLGFQWFWGEIFEEIAYVTPKGSTTR